MRGIGWKFVKNERAANLPLLCATIASPDFSNPLMHRGGDVAENGRFANRLPQGPEIAPIANRVYAQALFEFEPVERHKVVAGFDGGIITVGCSGSGCPLGRLDRGQFGLIRSDGQLFHRAGATHDCSSTRSRPWFGQRVFALALGYEDGERPR